MNNVTQHTPFTMKWMWERGAFSCPLVTMEMKGVVVCAFPWLIENFCPVIGWKGLDFTSLSGTLVCTKFMFFILFSHTHKDTTNN